MGQLAEGEERPAAGEGGCGGRRVQGRRRQGGAASRVRKQALSVNGSASPLPGYESGDYWK